MSADKSASAPSASSTARTDDAASANVGTGAGGDKDTDKAAPALSKKDAKALKQQRRAAQVAARGGPSTAPPSAAGAAAAASTSASTSGGSSSQAGQTQAGAAEHKGRPQQPHPQQQLQHQRHQHDAARSQGSTSSAQPASAAYSLLGHLPAAAGCSTKTAAPAPALANAHIHPSVATLCTLLSTHTLVGANARAMAVLSALRDFIQDYKTPPDAVLQRDLLTKISPQIGALVEARPLGTSAGHAIRYLKHEISLTPVDMDEEEAKENLLSSIDQFIRERIRYAGRVIQQHASAKIRDGDVIMTYARSSVVEQTLHAAWDAGKRFEVIVVDSRPLFEGQRLLASLTARSIPCTYANLTSLTSLVPRTSLVLLGTAALLANGCAYARAGTASCAMAAHAVGVPVIVCAETYKFSDRVQLDGIVVNELGDANALLNPARAVGVAAGSSHQLGGGAYAPPYGASASAAAHLALLAQSNLPPRKGGPPAPTKAATQAALAALSDPQQPSLPLSISEWAAPQHDAQGAGVGAAHDLSVATLLYDLTPSRYITAVASEVGLSGPESVAIIVRDYKSITDQV